MQQDAPCKLAESLTTSCDVLPGLAQQPSVVLCAQCERIPALLKVVKVGWASTVSPVIARPPQRCIVAGECQLLWPQPVHPEIESVSISDFGLQGLTACKRIFRTGASYSGLLC